MAASKGRILIVDDEKDIRFLLREILEDEGYEVAEAPHSEAAYADIAIKGMPDLVILDIWLENSDRDGMEILGDLKKRSKSLPVLMISGHGNIEMAVKAIKIGAFDFIEKPFNTDKLLHLVAKALDAGRKRRSGTGTVSLVTNSSEMQAIQKAAAKAAATDARVLVTGAWGTGRTHLARYIHQESGRAGKACIVLQCAGLEVIPLVDALATEGSVVLRDVQALSPAMQTEVLARLNAKPDARVMATASPDIEALKQEGRFSSDLYERLAVVQIAMPDAASRRSDMIDLCAQFLAAELEGMGVLGAIKITADAQAALLQMPLTAGFFELRTMCILAAIRMRADGAHECKLAYLQAGGAAACGGSVQAPADAVQAAVPGQDIAQWLQSDLRTARESFERWYFENLMARFDENVSQVASFAGMDRTALYRKLKSLKDGDAGQGNDGAEAA